MNDSPFSEIHIRELPPLQVVSCSAISATPEEDVSRHVTAWMAAQKLPPLRTFGFDIGVAPEQHTAGLRGYTLWVVAPAGIALDDDMTVRVFKGGLYAVMTIFDAFEEPFTRIPRGWEYLHNWVQANPQYEGAEHQMLEEVITELPAAAEGEGRRHLAIYYPVAPLAVGVPV